MRSLQRRREGSTWSKQKRVETSSYRILELGTYHLISIPEADAGLRHTLFTFKTEEGGLETRLVTAEMNALRSEDDRSGMALPIYLIENAVEIIFIQAS